MNRAHHLVEAVATLLRLGWVTMPDVYVFIRNQVNVAMSSVEGERFAVALMQNQALLLVQPVDLLLAELLFFNLSPGT